MHNKKHLFFWWVLIFGTLILGLYVFAGAMILKYRGMTADIGWNTAFENGSWYVSEVDSHGPTAGKLQVGDRVIATAR